MSEKSLYFSLSKLEKYRRVALGLTSFDTYEALVETLAGAFVPNHKTSYGNAFHAILESPARFVQNDGSYLVTPADGVDGVIEEHLFKPKDAQIIDQHRAAITPCSFEVSSKAVYQVAGRRVTVSLRADVLKGLTIRDTKTVFRKPEPQDYVDSLQWRVYLDALDCNRFVYDLFQVNETKSRGTELYEPVQIECVPYPGMRDDVLHWIAAFVKFCQDKGLVHYIESKY